ncbi:MAG TPA: TonB family protein [Candidatus Obscuribacterales bacterium]
MTAPDPELKIDQRITEAPSNTQEVVKSLGAYRVLEKVHTGHAGTTFRVSRKEDGREFALKLLKQELTRDQESMKRFLQEAGALSNLHHENIVSICDSGITQKGGAPFIVTDWIAGHSLEELIKQGPLSPERSAEIANELAQALQAAHEVGIFHRDVQPGNVIVGKDGVTHILDFGIAQVRPEGQRITRTGAVIGTSKYMSPEQYLGHSADARTDIYGLGCLLYTMITARAPFESDNIGKSMALTVGADRSFVAEGLRLVNCPQGLETIIMTMLAREPNARYQTMDEVCTMLSAFEKGMPIGASFRWTKGSKRAAVAALVVLVLIPLSYLLSARYAAWMRSTEQDRQDQAGYTQLPSRNPLTFEPSRHHHHIRHLVPYTRLHPGLTYLRDLERRFLNAYAYSPANENDTRRTTVRFRISSTGAVDDLSVYKPSGDAALDYSACVTIRHAAPFEPITTDYYSEKEREAEADAEADAENLVDQPSLSVQADAAVREADEQLRAFLRGDFPNEETAKKKSALIEVTLPPKGKNWLHLISVD